MASIGFIKTTGLICCFVFGSVLANECCSCEPWKLERSHSEPIFVSFTNGTYPGRYTSLIWRWKAITTGEWETTVRISHITGDLLGSMTFRDGKKQIVNSLMWRLDGSNLTWSSQGYKVTDVDWSLSVPNIGKWKFENNITGNWIFKLNDIVLEKPSGEKKISNPLENDFTFADVKNSIGFHRKKRNGLNGHPSGPPVNGERAWKIVREVLDRVFGSGEDVRREGWISHVTNLLQTIGTAVTSLAGVGGVSGGSEAPTSITTPDTPTEVETFNPNDLRDIKDNEIRKKEISSTNAKMLLSKQQIIEN